MNLAQRHSPPAHISPRPLLHDAEGLEQFRRVRRIDPHRIRQMRYGLYRLAEPLEAALARLGPAHQAAVRNAFELAAMEVVQRRDSTLDGSSKLVMQASDGSRFETVLMRAASGRTTICASTQVGCGAGCPFCATSRMGLRRHLTWQEIIEQIVLAARLARQQQQRIRNRVFMGMGEPLHNEENLHEALQLLLDSSGFAFAPRRLTVSTVGVPDAMVRLADRFPGVHIALSLHSAKPELRARLVPWSRQHAWDDLRQALCEIANRPTNRNERVIMIEYLMIAGVNDGDGDAEALIEYLREIPVIVNLIPLNPIPGLQWQPTPRADRERFAGRLRAAGVFTTIRYSMGADVQAACGQLVQST